jgi:Ca2+-binding RTX toxin-like protein
MAIIFGNDAFDDVLFTTFESDTVIAGSGNDYIFGSSGFDVINGGSGFDTIDYRFLNTSITLLPTGLVDKGTAGTDQLVSVETIVAPLGRGNWINALTDIDSPVSVTVNLSENSLQVNNIPNVGTLSRTVVNFTNVIGTNQADILIGDAQDNILNGAGGDDIIVGLSGNNLLLGGSGNDIVIGGDGNDILVGYGNTDGEVDILVGGAGADLFVLGDAFGSYYSGSGYAILVDFNPFENDKIQVFGRRRDYTLIPLPVLSRDVADTLIFKDNDLVAIVQGTTSLLPNIDFITV